MRGRKNVLFVWKNMRTERLHGGLFLALFNCTLLTYFLRTHSPIFCCCCRGCCCNCHATIKNRFMRQTSFFFYFLKYQSLSVYQQEINRCRIFENVSQMDRPVERKSHKHPHSSNSLDTSESWYCATFESNKQFRVFRKTSMHV